MNSRQSPVRMLILVGFAAVVLLAAVWALSGNPSSKDGASLRVVTTTPLFADLVSNVGGERVQVTSLLPLGADPHTFEPTPRDVRAVSEADLLFYNGFNFEIWLDKVLQNVGAPTLQRIQLPEGLTPRPYNTASIDDDDHEDHDHAHEHGAFDPHFWLDVRYAMHYVQRIAAALSEADPEGADEYAARATSYLEELSELDRWIEEQIAGIPPESRRLVTHHDSFGYFAERYGLEVVGFLVVSPDVEPSAQRMASLIRSIEELGVPAVFADGPLNPRLVETLALDAGVEVGILYTDTLTHESPTYIALMRANVEALVEGLRS